MWIATTAGPKTQPSTWPPHSAEPRARPLWSWGLPGPTRARLPDPRCLPQPVCATARPPPALARTKPRLCLCPRDALGDTGGRPSRRRQGGPTPSPSGCTSPSPQGRIRPDQEQPRGGLPARRRPSSPRSCTCPRSRTDLPGEPVGGECRPLTPPEPLRGPEGCPHNALRDRTGSFMFSVVFLTEVRFCSIRLSRARATGFVSGKGSAECSVQPLPGQAAAPWAGCTVPQRLQVPRLAPGRSPGGYRDPATLWPRDAPGCVCGWASGGPLGALPYRPVGLPGKGECESDSVNRLHSREKPGENLEPHDGQTEPAQG